MQGEEFGRLLKQERGQFLEFLSAYDYRRSGAQKKPVDDLTKESARILSGMANADGGTLLLGVESDKSVTGIPHDATELRIIGQAPLQLLHPPLSSTFERVQLGNLLVVKFEVAAKFEVSQAFGGRSFYRCAAETVSLPSEQIQSLKEAKKSVAYERQEPLNATWDDLDPAIMESFSSRLDSLQDAQTALSRTYRLVDNSGKEPRPNMAGLLLFARDPISWHSRCGIDFVKFDGIERRHGAALNIVKRIRFESPLLFLIDEAVGRIKEHIRERTILHALFFRERLEYPNFAWQEALVNAVAHRDYAITGACVEVWMFDDRIEIRSPGLLPPPVTIEHLQQRKSVHFSRNPLIVRVLADHGYLRESGEGIPRMFQEMEQHGLRGPEFSTEGFSFVVTLRNTPVYDEATVRWLNQFAPAQINFRQRRLLAYAYCPSKIFSTTEYERVAEVDRDTAYREIRSLMKNGIVAPLKPKSKSYRIIERL